MVDWADFNTPARAPYSYEMESIVEDLNRTRPAGLPGGWKRNKIYSRVADLRPYGIDALVFEDQMGENPAGKIQIFRAGDKTIGDYAEIVNRVYMVDPWKLRPMRLDLTADVKDVTVNWCKKNIKIACKQKHEEWVRPDPATRTISQGWAETIMGGGRVGQYRNYDKNGHRMVLWREECRRVDYLNRQLFRDGELKKIVAAVELGEYDPAKMERWSTETMTQLLEKNLKLPRYVERPTFDQMFPGVNPKDVLTRFEMSYGRRASLESMSQYQMCDLFKIDQEQPFETLKFLAAERFVDWPDGFTTEQYCTLTYLRNEVKCLGIQSAWNFFRSRKDRANAYRDWKLYEPFLSEGIRLCTPAILQSEYAASTRQQQHAA